MKIKRCTKSFHSLISALQKVKGNEKLVEKLQEAAFKIGVKGAPTKVKRIYNRCISRYHDQDVYCASIAWSIFCSNNSNRSHCRNFV